MKKIDIFDGGITLNFDQNSSVEHFKAKDDDIVFVQTPQSGWALIANDRLKYMQRDCCVYTEMLAHGALYSHFHPLDVLVVGAGDGFLIREILKHRSVRQIYWIIDSENTQKVARQYFNGIDLEAHPKVSVLDQDALDHVRSKTAKYDIILVDSDYNGASKRLLTHDFYQSLSSIAKDGMVVFCYAGALDHDASRIKNMASLMSSHFSHVGTYAQSTGNQWGGRHTWLWGAGTDLSNVNQEAFIDRSSIISVSTQYFNLERFVGAFHLDTAVDDQAYTVQISEAADQKIDQKSETASQVQE